MSILDLPGNLGPTRGSFLTIHHYDWPAYPTGDDFRETLFQLSAFPEDTEFVEIGDGDQSILFAANVPCGKLEEPYDSRNLHVCAWYEDLLELHSRGFITGVEPVTANAHECERWNRTLRENKVDKLCVVLDGVQHEVPGPTREPDDEDEPRSWVLLPDQRISVSTAGTEFIVNELIGAQIDFAATLSPTVQKLMKERLYDTAVREGCVTLEHAIRSALRSSKWGDQLTDAFLDYLRNEKNAMESWLRTYRQELRAVFKLCRNVYMHSLIEIDEPTAIVALFRLSRAISAVRM